MGTSIGMQGLWQSTNAKGGTIQKALDYALSFNANATDEFGAVPQMFPIVADTRLALGDPTGKYLTYLKQNDPVLEQEPFWFWDVRSPDGRPVPASVLDGQVDGSSSSGGGGYA